MSALVASLGRLSGTNAALTQESLAAWRTNFQQLVEGGPASINAIQAFLSQQTDTPFSREAWQATGFPSARIAALDALRQIGGPEAISLMENMLATDQSPEEIAYLAKSLEMSAPGQHRDQELAAARAGLQAALASNDPKLDVAPLFEIFQHFGGTAAVPDLEAAAAGPWKYYATMALASLPDGAGIPSLLRMADPATGSGGRVVALEMVAQLAADNPAAKTFLLNQIAGNYIGPNLWPYLTSPLSGDQYFPVDSVITTYPALQSSSDLKTTHLASGNQNLYSLPGDQSMTADAINQRITLVDELLKAANDAAAQQALQRARDILSQRANRPVAQTPPGSAQPGTSQP